MNSTKDVVTNRPSAGYLLSVGLASLGFTFAACVVGGTWNADHGLDAISVLNGVGAVAFAFSYSPLFVLRLIFWDRSSALSRKVSRLFISSFIMFSIILSVVAVLMVLSTHQLHGASAALIFTFTVLAAFCQIGSTIWLIRYRGI